MKKFLAVATALMLAISSLCVFVVADEYELVTEVAVTSFSNGNYLADVIDDVRAALSGGGYMEIDAEADSTGGAWFQAGVSDSTWTWGSSASSVTWLNAGDSQTITITSSDFAAVADFDDAWTAIYVQGGSTLNVTAIRVYGVVESSSGTDEPAESGDTVDYVYTMSASSTGGTAVLTAVDSALYTALTTEGTTITMTFTYTGSYNFALAVQDTSTWGGSWWTISASGTSDGSEPVTVTWTDLSSLTGSAYLIADGSQLLINNNESVAMTDITVTVSVPVEKEDEPGTSAATDGYDVVFTATSSDLDTSDTDTNLIDWHVSSVKSSFYAALQKAVVTDGVSGVLIEVTSSVADPEVGLQLNIGSSYPYKLGTAVATDTDGVYTISVDEIIAAFEADGVSFWDESFNSLFASSADYKNAITQVRILVPSTSTEPSTSETTTSSATRAYGCIYVNEQYHGFLIMRNGTKHLACVPHTVDANGYCTVCKEYIGVDGDAATTEINGGEYVVAYSQDLLFTSSGWGTYEFSDNSLIDALSVEGSILVITRDRETSITFGDSTYEKFGLVDSWWSGDWIALGTGGHTDADEESATIIDCISDDGINVMYDGNTIYDAWVAAGMSNGGVATLITNTSGLYQITNVTVYVPAGSTTVEEVDVTEPQESTDTETEDDETDDVDVSETDTDDTTDVAESNPTTGVVLALVPMAVAGLAVVASKRR